MFATSMDWIASFCLFIHISLRTNDTNQNLEMEQILEEEADSAL